MPIIASALFAYRKSSNLKDLQSRFQDRSGDHGPSRRVIRIPGGKPVAICLATLGLLTTILSSVLACIPPGDEPNKLLAVLKIIGSSALTVAIGAWIYFIGKRRKMGSNAG